MSVRRWFFRRFLTRVKPTMVNRNGGEVISSDTPALDLVPGWEVSRPEWWGPSSLDGVSDVSVEQARQRLDEWQDDMWRRHRVGETP